MFEDWKIKNKIKKIKCLSPILSSETCARDLEVLVTILDFLVALFDFSQNK